VRAVHEGGAQNSASASSNGRHNNGNA